MTDLKFHNMVWIFAKIFFPKISLIWNTIPLRPFVGEPDLFVGDFGKVSDFSSASSFPISRFSSASFFSASSSAFSFSASSSAFSFSSGSALSSSLASAASAVSSLSSFSFSSSSFFSSYE